LQAPVIAYIIIYIRGEIDMQLNSHEQNCLNNAIGFTAVRGIGAKRTRQDFTCIEDAKAYAATFGDKRTMLYAITEVGHNAHICNI
jgi:hypothetical protein